jgi:hypothetical protein
MAKRRNGPFGTTQWETNSKVSLDILYTQRDKCMCLISRITGCAVKGGGPQRELNPPGN